jgi:heme oxygenase-like protein
VITAPAPRGEISDLVVGALSGPPAPLPPMRVRAVTDALSDEDLQLALYLCYELHYRGVPGADDAWEWEPSLLALRRRLERQFEDALCEAVPRLPAEVAPEEIDLALRGIAEADEGRPLSRHVEREATLEQVREFLVHRSAYQLKEADPHSWALPRLDGRPNAALVEIQADEYGGGRADRIHAELFAVAMEAIGLDRRYGAYLEHVPGVTLATVNLMSFFGLHRRHRGAIVGHLALFEMTSSVPNARYAAGLRRLGLGERATAFFDEHVEADAVHENVAAVDLAGGLAREEPALAGDVLWGARCLAALDRRWGDHLLDAWEAGVTSLRLGLRATKEAPVA